MMHGPRNVKLLRRRKAVRIGSVFSWTLVLLVLNPYPANV